MSPIKKLLNNSFLLSLTGVLFACSLIFSISMIVRAPLSADSYLHLGIGKYIVTNRTIPTHEMISYKPSQPALEWLTHGWLGDSLLYILASPNVSLISPIILIAILLTSIAILFAIYKRLQVPLFIQLFVTSVGLLTMPIFWRLHPIILITQLALLTILTIISSITSKRPLLIFLLPVISLVWANTYGGFIFIFSILIFAYFIYLIVDRYSSNPHKWAVSPTLFLLTSLASFGTSLINPVGILIWTYSLSFASIVNIKKAFSSYPGYLLLINQSFLRENISTVPYAVALALILIALTTLIIVSFSAKRRTWLKDMAITVPPFALVICAAYYVRLTPLVILVSLPLISLLLNHMVETYKTQSRIIFTICTVLLIPVFVLYSIFPLKVLRVDAPVQQVALIKELGLPINILTNAEHMGYVFYVLQHKMNIDLFDDLFDESETFNLLINGGIIDPTRLEEMFQSQQISTILFDKESGNLTRSVLDGLKKKWALLYFDAGGFLFVKRELVESEMLDTNELKFVNLTTSLGTDPNNVASAEAELEKFVQKYPKNTMAQGQLASLYRVQKKPEQAADILYSLPAAEWDYTIYTEMGRIQASMGNCSEAEQFLKAALDDRAEQNYSQAVLDLAIIYGGCLNDKESARHYFERYLSFAIPQSEKEKARKLAADFGIDMK